MIPERSRRLSVVRFRIADSCETRHGGVSKLRVAFYNWEMMVGAL